VEHYPRAFMRLYYLEQGTLNDPDAMLLAWAALLRLLERVAPGYRD
jgi:hypothetical protein